MQITENLCPSSKYSVKCPYSMSPIGVCIHNTANDASAKNEVAYMLGNGSKTSYHYAVDDKEIVHAIADNRNAWHAGDGGSGKGNRKYISIEICYSKSGGPRFEAAMKNAAWLTAKLLREHNWTVANVKKHQDFSGKYCPHRILSDYGWDCFLNLVKAELGGESAAPQKVGFEPGKIYTVKITADSLNVRDGAGADYPINTSVAKNGVYTVVEVRNGWGLLKSGSGWINLAYTAVTGYTDRPTVMSARDAVSALANKGVISSPEYWLGALDQLPYLPNLVIKMANTDLRPDAKNGYTNAPQAAKAMADAGVIDSPDYWTANYSRVQYLEELLVKFANKLWM